MSYLSLGQSGSSYIRLAVYDMLFFGGSGEAACIHTLCINFST
jgi:hypothetical protein